jgi:membrane fusion protein (multidrug efflux system)
MSFFYKNKNTHATPQPVVTGKWIGTDWVILDGLKAGDKVIVDNIIKLRPGSPVTPHAPGEAPGTPLAQPDSDSGKAA